MTVIILIAVWINAYTPDCSCKQEKLGNDFVKHAVKMLRGFIVDISALIERYNERKIGLLVKGNGSVFSFAVELV